MFRHAFLLAACGLVLLSGCESSDKATTPLTPGNNNDANFQFVSDEVVDGQAFEGVDLSLDLTGSLIDSISSGAPTRALWSVKPAIDGGELVIQSYSYSLQGTWHIFQVSGFVALYSPVDTLDLVGMDSIQLLSNEAPITYPDETMDGFQYRLTFNVWSRTDIDSASGHHDVQIRLVDSATANLSAEMGENIRFHHSDSVATCDVSLANSLQATDVLIDFGSGGCPLGGSVVLTSAISLDCQGTGGNFSTSVDGVWTIRGHFDGVTEDFTVTNGNTVWTSSEPCGGPAQAALRF